MQRIRFGTGLAIVGEAASLAALMPALPFYGVELGASPLLLGMVVAAFPLVAFVSSGLWLKWTVRLGRRPVILIHLFGATLSAAVLSLCLTDAPTPDMKTVGLVFSRVLLGLLGYPHLFALFALCEGRFEPSRGRIDPSLVILWSAGSLIGLGTSLFAFQWLDWRGPPLLSFVILVVTFLVCLVVLPESAQPGPWPSGRVRLWTGRNVRKILLFAPHVVSGLALAQLVLIVPLTLTPGRFHPEELSRPYAIALKLARPTTAPERFLQSLAAPEVDAVLENFSALKPDELRTRLCHLFNQLLDTDELTELAVRREPSGSSTNSLRSLFEGPSRGHLGLIRMKRHYLEQVFEGLIQPRVQFNPAALPLLLAAAALAALLVAIGLGMLVDEDASPRVLSLGAGVAGIGSVYIVHAEHLIHVLIGLGAIGAGVAALFMTAVGLTTRLAPLDRFWHVRLWAWKMMCLGAGGGAIVSAILYNWNPSLPLSVLGWSALCYLLISLLLWRML